MPLLTRRSECLVNVVSAICSSSVSSVNFFFFFFYPSRLIREFIESLYKVYVDLYFTYLEINPLVVTSDSIYILDLAAKLDATADFMCRYV